jgi:glycosyltransferase involved in cell wall biosynthesis
VPRSDRSAPRTREAAARRTEVEQLRLAANDELVDVTVVLPVYNEVGHIEEELARTVAALEASDYVYDLDVYDDGSTDGTRDILKRIDAEGVYPRMRYIPRARNGGSGTIRRIGSQEARGRIVAWTDADMTYPNERIPEFVQMLDDDPSFDQVVGAAPRRRAPTSCSRPGEVDDPQDRVVPHRTKIPDLNSGCGCSGARSRCPTCRCCRRASPASRR